MDLQTTAMAAGGDAIARDPDGRVVFVEGALPGETVRAAVLEERRDFARARVVEVLSPSPDRLDAGAAALDGGCPGCPWQGVAPAAQGRLKRGVVVDALRRIAGATDVVAADVPSVSPTGYRTTVRAAVLADGRAAYRARHSHDLVPMAGCTTAHPLVDELVREGRYHGAEEVALRAGARTRERLVLARPTAEGVVVPGDVFVVGEDAGRSARRASFTEQAAGRRWRISATSFFQSGPEAAELLVDAVRAAVGTALDDGGTVVDAYAGVGLLGGTLAARRDDVDLVAVESNATAARDARHNLADVEAEVVQADVGRWDGGGTAGATVVVADPARAGLGKKAAAVLAGTAAPVFVLVACDPASLARDTRLLIDAGYRLASVQVLDLFPQTVHVEAVARFTLAP